MPAKKLGKNGILARNTGNFAAPAWSRIGSLKDITINRAPSAVIDSTDRFQHVKTSIPIRYKVGVDTTTIWDGGTAQTALRDACLAGTVLDLAVLDGPAAEASEGLRGEWLISKFALDMSLTAEQKLSISLMPHGNHAAGQGVSFYTDLSGAPGVADVKATKKQGQFASVNDALAIPILGIRDIKLGLEWDTADAGDREDQFEKFLPTQFKVDAEITFAWDSSVAGLVAFYTAFKTHATLALSILDGPFAVAGSWGALADWSITDFGHTMPLTEGQIVTAKLMPAGNSATLTSFITTA